MQKQKVFWHRVRNILIVLAMMNILLIWNCVPIGMGMMVPVTILLVLGYIYCNIRPVHVSLSGRRLKIMDAGYELIVTAGVSIVLEIVLGTVLFLCQIGTFSLKNKHPQWNRCISGGSPGYIKWMYQSHVYFKRSGGDEQAIIAVLVVVPTGQCMDSGTLVQKGSL